MPSYLDFDSTKNFRDALLAKTLQAPNGPQTFSSGGYSVQKTNSFSNSDQGDVTLNDQTSRTAQLQQTDGTNRFGPENSQYNVVENMRILVDQTGNSGIYPYFPIADTILGRTLIGALNTQNYEFESKLAQFANYNLTESPEGPVQARIKQNLRTATEGRVRILDAINGNLASAVNIIRGREDLVEKNYKITVAKTAPGKVVDFLQTVAGVEFPWTEIPGDYLTDPANPIVNRPTPKTEFGKVWQDATGALGSLLGIQRRPKMSRKPSDLMIEYLSDGQRDQLYNNLSFSKYAPNYTLKARSQNTSKIFNFIDNVASGLNKLVGREAPEGKAYIGDDRGNDVKNILQDFNENKVLSPYYLSLLFDQKATELFSIESNISERGPIGGNLTWYSTNSQNKLGANNLEYSSQRGQLEDSLSTQHDFREDSILGKTQALLNTLPKNGGEARSHVANVIDQTSRIFKEGNKIMSRGSAIRYVDKNTGAETGTEFCRVWTKDRAYMNYSDTMKRTGPIRKINDSVMSTPWNLNIAPVSTGNRSFKGSTNIEEGSGGKDPIGGKAKKYMFSIENLAWKTSNKPGYTVNDLPMCERGPNGGRVMWFPPYDLKVAENNTANWDKSSFLGRPEPIFTYQNTERSGTISFKVIVDHPSILNLLIKEISDEEAENFLNSFFAGCHEVDFYTLLRKYITLDASDLELIQAYLSYYRDNKKIDESTVLQFKSISGDRVDKNGHFVDDPNGSTSNGGNLRRTTATVYFPNDIPLPKTDTYSIADYGKIYSDYIGHKEQYKTELGNALDDILSVNTKFNIADREVIFGTKDPTKNGTVSKQTLINNAKTQLDDAYSKLTSEFGQITGATATFKEELEKNNVDKDIKIKITSTTSFVADDTYNIKLSHRRSDSLVKYFLKSISKSGNVPKYVWNKTVEQLNENPAETTQTVSIPLKDLGYGDDKEDKSIIVEFVNKGEKATITSADGKLDCHNTVINNKTGLKKHAPITFYCRSANFEFTYNTKVTTEPEPKQKYIPGESIVGQAKTTIDVVKNGQPKRPPLDVVKRLIMKALSECFYFKKLEETDPVVFGSLKEKLRYFHPAFHSMTPEGLNARLTFLHQCIRPGDTIPVKRLGTEMSGTVVDSRNTTFGPPPVCVLRIGDFYHSKVVITNMNIEYEGSTWDLNPEGIGVQPMLANVTLQVNFIGGQGIKEPVAKLQNALSSNFYANTEVYDYRADSTASGIGDKDVVGFNIDFIEQLVGKVATPDIAADYQKNNDKIEGKWIGTPDKNTMGYNSLVQDLVSSTNDYFDSFSSAYKLLYGSYGKEVLPIFISPVYRKVNQLDVQNTVNGTTQINLLGKYDNLIGFSKLSERFRKALTEKVDSSDHNNVFGIVITNQSKYDRSRDIIDGFVKKSVIEFLDKIDTEKTTIDLEEKRNKLIQNIDKLNFIVATNGKDAQISKKETVVATLTDFDADDFYSHYSKAIDLIKDKHSIFTDDLSTDINFVEPSISNDLYKKLLAFIIKDNVAKIIKEYKDSPDKGLFDENTINNIESKINKFIDDNGSKAKAKEFKYSKVNIKKDLKPYEYTSNNTMTLSTSESEVLDKILTGGDKSNDLKLNFLKPGR